MDSYSVFGPLLRLLDPETAHGLVIKALKNNLVPRPAPYEDSVLRTEVWNRKFTNPIGLAAGFDKNAEVVDGMLAQGFGFVEAGSVTARPQPGNPRPRLFRLKKDMAVINRIGSNSEGAHAVADRLRGRQRVGVVGINLGKNKDSWNIASDYVEGIRVLTSFADYMVLNVSSPNTPGLRKLQSRDHLADLLVAVKVALSETALLQPPPLLLKIAPDLTDDDKSDIAEISLAVGIDGLIATNTTVERPASLADPHRAEVGGLSGPPLMAPSTQVLGEMYRLTNGALPIIGCGGVQSGADAYAKIRAGASLVQLYSALVYRGPGLVNHIKRQLAELLKADGFTNVAEAVGADHR